MRITKDLRPRLKQKKYNSVTLYLHDKEGQPHVLTTSDFKIATLKVKELNATIVYINDYPEDQYQEWGLRL
jgi:hypothetical protein